MKILINIIGFFAGWLLPAVTASFNMFDDFPEQLGLETHTLTSDTLKVMLTNSAPLATNTVKTDITEITAANGYTAGGEDVTNTWSETGGTATLDGTNIVWTASGGAINTFRYAVLYNDTAASKNLIGWWDYGSAVDVGSGETFTFSITTNLLTVAG